MFINVRPYKKEIRATRKNAAFKSYISNVRRTLWENDRSALRKTGLSRNRGGLETRAQIFHASFRNATHFLKVKVQKKLKRSLRKRFLGIVKKAVKRNENFQDLKYDCISCVFFYRNRVSVLYFYKYLIRKIQ